MKSYISRNPNDPEDQVALGFLIVIFSSTLHLAVVTTKTSNKEIILSSRGSQPIINRLGL